MKRRIIETIVVCTIFCAGMLLNIFQTVMYKTGEKSRVNTVYPYVHNHIEDYYYYLHLMRQGYDGNFLATSRMTPEKFAPQFINPFFLLFGKLSALSHVSIPSVYTLSRIAGGLVLLGLTYIFSYYLFPKKPAFRIIILLFTVFGAYFPSFDNKTISVAPLVSFWSELDPTFRLSFVPHHLWAKVFMMAAYMLIWRSLSNRIGLKTSILIVTAVIISGLINPVIMATFIPVIIVWFVFEAFALSVSPKKSFSETFSYLKPFIFSILSGVAVALYSAKVQHSVFPWTSYLEWEKVQYPVTILSYIQSLGPGFLLFIAGIITLVKKPGGRLFISWTVVGYILLFILGPHLPLTNSRYLGGYQFIPVAFGSLAGALNIKKIFFKLTGSSKISIIIAGIIICLYFINSFLAFNSSLKLQLSYISRNTNNFQVYIPEDYIEAFRFLDKNIKKDEVVLSPLFTGTMIPAFTSARVVAGHLMMTKDFAEKLREIEAFYRENDVKFASDLIKKYGIKYIWDSQAPGVNQYYIGVLQLKKIYENSSVTIWGI